MSSQRVIERSDATIVLTSVETAWTTSDGWRLTETTEMADIFGDRTPADERHPTLFGERVDLGPVSRLRIAWCCTATEDLQDVHHDADLARARGYDDVLVPGTLLAAIAEGALRNRYPSLEKLSLRFTAPLYPDDALSLTIGHDGENSAASLEFVASRAFRPDRVVAVGAGAVTR
jgi:acyl dehydratase